MVVVIYMLWLVWLWLCERFKYGCGHIDCLDGLWLSRYCGWFGHGLGYLDVVVILMVCYGVVIWFLWVWLWVWLSQ